MLSLVHGLLQGRNGEQYVEYWPQWLVLRVESGLPRLVYPTPTARFFWNSGPVANGKLHWMVALYRGEGNLEFVTKWIICFDLITDEFVELAMQPNNGEGNTIVMGLGVLDECL